MRTKNRLLLLIGTLLAVLALLDQVGRRPQDRDWQGRILGIPYDFRMPTVARMNERLWNRVDERIVVPQVIGIGWTINFYQLKRRIQLLVA